MLSGFAVGEFAVDGAMDRECSCTGVAGVILIRFPSEACVVVTAGVGDGAPCAEGTGVREGEGLDELGGDSAELSAGEVVAGLESLAKRLLRI